MPGGMVISAARRRTEALRLGTHVPSASLLAAGLLISVGASAIVGKLEESQISDDFDSVAHPQIHDLHREIQANLGTVQSLLAFFQSTRQVNRTEFQTFASSQMAQHRSLKALEWLPRVPMSDCEEFERRAREDGYPEFRITELTEDGRIVPAQRTGDAFPVYFVEPVAGNESAFGLDVASEPTRRAVLEAARDSGQLRVTPPIELVQSASGEYGFLAAAPIYDRSLPTGTVDLRREALTGYVLGVFEIGELVVGAMWNEGVSGDPGAEAFDVFVFDEPNGRAGATARRLIYAGRMPDGRPLDPPRELPRIRTESPVDVADRRWHVVVAPADGFPFPGRTWLPWAVLVGGLVFSVAAVRGYQSRASTLARLHELTETLSRRNEALEDLSTKLSLYIPAQILRSILSGSQDVAITTQRKRLTVFCSDIERFTEVTVDLQPEDVTFLVNDYFSEMSDIATEYGATLDKFVGDSMLMFFGDPETKGVEEDALACVNMAVAMQQRMVALRERWRAMGYGNAFHMRIAINTGFCDVGNFGSRERVQYTAIGREVNKAVRLEALAEPGGIVLAPETYALVADHFDATEGDPVLLKGVPNPVRPYSLVFPDDRSDGRDRFIRAENRALRLTVDLSRMDAELREDAISRLDEIRRRLEEDS
jgi:class 3 adenylate cyclase/CHASE1-domain containing sensor protein